MYSMSSVVEYKEILQSAQKLSPAKPIWEAKVTPRTETSRGSTTPDTKEASKSKSVKEEQLSSGSPSKLADTTADSGANERRSRFGLEVPPEKGEAKKEGKDAEKGAENNVLGGGAGTVLLLKCGENFKKLRVTMHGETQVRN